MRPKPAFPPPKLPEYRRTGVSKPVDWSAPAARISAVLHGRCKAVGAAKIGNVLAISARAAHPHIRAKHNGGGTGVP